MNEEFIIDKTLGRDVKFTLDVSSGSGTIEGIQLLYPNGTELYHNTNEIYGTTLLSFDFLEVIFFWNEVGT